ncbi:DUF4911 domain-containing protein [Geobacter sp.]|uniref:DUF4911 domain-containing protein n=1 Tax=Geobacter sp. TaxID=46610 RepID=UPI0027B9C4B4|nr:DUF4911 domain-containing protein [Geobacter sp.]
MYQPNEITRYFQVARRDLAYLKFIVEAHEGLATLSTADRETSTVVITYSSYFTEEMNSLLESLGTEIAMQEVSGTEISNHA